MRITFLIIFCILFSGAWTLPASAFTVGPSRQTLVIDPGTEQTARLFVLNDGTTEQEYLPLVDSFGRNAETGNIELSIPEPAKRWVTIKPSVLTLKPGERGEFLFTIAVPESATPGAHYLSFFAKEKQTEGQISISASAGSLGYIYVSGNIQESLQIEQFEPEKTLSFTGKNTLSIGIKNTGNIHLNPKAFLQLQKNNGEKLFQKTIFDNRTLLASEQTFTSLPITKQEIPYIGKVRATVLLQYGFSEQIVTEEISFWILPWWLLGGSAMIFLFLTLLIIRKWFRS